MKNWKTVRLGEVLKQSKNQIELDPEKTYRQVTIRLNRKGVVLRGLIQGNQVGSKQFLAKSNQFIVSRIDARNGAYGIVPKELEGAIVTNDFLLFETDTKIDVDFLNYYSNTSIFGYECNKASEGTTNRVRLKIDKFLNIEIPLPPLAEQKRIVAKLETVQKAVEKVRILRGEQEKLVKRLKNGILEHFKNPDEIQSIGNVLEKSKDYVQPQFGIKYRQVGVKWWGEGAYERETIDGGGTSYTSFCHLKKGDFIFNKIWVRNGALAIVKENTEGCFAPNEFPVYKCKETVDSKWLELIVSSSIFWEHCSNLSQGTSGKSRIKPEKLLEIKVWIPPLSMQKDYITLIAKLETLKIHQNTQRQAIE